MFLVIRWSNNGYLEILGNFLKFIPWKGHTFDEGVFLPLDVNHSFIKYDAFFLVREHLDQAFHEILISN